VSIVAARKYEQGLRAEAAEQTRRRILDAVYERLRAAPSERVSVEQIARSARVARSTVYVVFGSRAGLFDALAKDLVKRGGFDRVLEAVADADAREHLRGGIRGNCEFFAADRDVHRALQSMSALNPDALAGAVQRWEQRRTGGMTYLAQRLADQDLLRPDVTPEQAAHLLWLLTSFDSFDLLYTGRGLSVGEVADVLTTTAERSLCQ
jgi:AcrR family transcriptional regulator